MTTFIQLVVSGIGSGAAYSLVGIGMVIVFRTTGIINFAQGAFAVMAGLITAQLAGQMPVALAALIAVAITMTVGVAMGFVAIGRRGITTPLASLIITIGLAFLAEAIELIVFGDSPLTYPAVGQRAWSIAGILVLPQYALTFGLASAFAIALGLGLSRTIVGHALVASSDSRHAAELVGLDPRVLGMASFALAALLGAVGGIVITPIDALQFDSDISIAVNAFVAAVFGGLVSIRGAFIGGLVLGVAEALVSGYISADYNLTIALVLMLVLMVARAGATEAVEA
ncbi:MAG: branched-chain amino acid ABC transporter permease [Solirubrobacteraceae bacterium]